MARGLDVEARLVITWNGHDLQLAGSGTYLILNIPSAQVLDALTGADQKSSRPKAPKPANAPDPLQQINDLMLRLGLVLDLRVAGKTWVTFGNSRSPKITLNAVLGKIGSFFRS
ncbi:hypothetical protein F0P96_03745 [Hymenobacter busanensis]|uniref:Uncharacterized protein n=1 Tax=Hymenobacter busanensis TaxID=2607656 RepID=A0A7L4ZUL2_9BACT|nr:hypothetical protein [Hymenobacter busanensis]KAA9339740.1 hypothetical protein F0P96_03745 [Hymenobacter busanensis]QHJ06506.1 hypothetical protein GUY19_04005 [Hymenobacter busanensis]